MTEETLNQDQAEAERAAGAARKHIEGRKVSGSGLIRLIRLHRHADQSQLINHSVTSAPLERPLHHGNTSLTLPLCSELLWVQTL